MRFFKTVSIMATLAATLTLLASAPAQAQTLNGLNSQWTVISGGGSTNVGFGLNDANTVTPSQGDAYDGALGTSVNGTLVNGTLSAVSAGCCGHPSNAARGTPQSGASAPIHPWSVRPGRVRAAPNGSCPRPACCHPSHEWPPAPVPAVRHAPPSPATDRRTGWRCGRQ